MSEPLVSILIPTYNGELFLKPALRSALEQTHRTVEVIVADDGSTDSTPQILDAFEAADDRVRVIRHASNIGAFDNITGLYAEARGEYVKFLLHDDVLTNDCVRELVRGFESSPDVRLAFSRRVLTDENGRPVAGHEFPRLADRPGTLDGRELGDRVLETCENVIGELSTILFRRSDVPLEGLWEVDGRRVQVLTDVHLALQLLAQGDAWYTPRVLSRFRRHAGQNTWKPGVAALANHDWPILVEWAARQGFLADPDTRRRTLVHVLQLTSHQAGQLIDAPELATGLEGVFLATTALAEHLAGDPVGDGPGLFRRAHAASALARFAQEPDAWTADASPR